MQNKIYKDNDTWSYDNCTLYFCSKTEFNEVREGLILTSFIYTTILVM